MGLYSRIEWPEAGSSLEQCNCIVEIFDIIKDEWIKIRKQSRS